MDLREYIKQNESVVKTLVKNGVISTSLIRNCEIYDRKIKGESSFSISVDYNMTKRSVNKELSKMRKKIH